MAHMQPAGGAVAGEDDLFVSLASHGQSVSIG
jgi:hypothetical protein